MKLFQSNFTTPEQSRRLLELGLPADSADMYYSKLHSFDDYGEPCIIGENATFSSISEHYRFDYLPCWSVGRLIEIIMLCGISANHKLKSVFDSDLYETHSTLIEYRIQELEENDDWYNFSKLEE